MIFESTTIKIQRAFLTIIVLCLADISFAQKFNDVTSEREPLVLKSTGSFYVGGKAEEQTKSEMGGFFPDGHLTVNQLYVNFMKPQKLKDSTSIVLIHGMNLSGKIYETTPDGRMGWNEYFVRNGYPVYVVDQVGIGRSGFNQKAYNKVRNKEAEPNQQPGIIRISDENTSVNFRFTTKDNKPVPNAKFQIVAIDEFSKQSIPFMATIWKMIPVFRDIPGRPIMMVGTNLLLV